jgi:hypothetical protein
LCARRTTEGLLEKTVHIGDRLRIETIFVSACGTQTIEANAVMRVFVYSHTAKLDPAATWFMHAAKTSAVFQKGIGTESSRADF